MVKFKEILLILILLSTTCVMSQISADNDTTFNPGTGANNNVRVIKIQNDDKIILAGDFTIFNGISKNRIVRLNVDGSLDTTFNPGTGANQTIYALAIQNDGKIMVGGSFTTFNGISKNRIVRLNSDGSIDTTFMGIGPDNDVHSIAFQSNNKIIVGGMFYKYNGIPKKGLVRLNSNGTLDSTFIHPLDYYNWQMFPAVWVKHVNVQSDDKIIIGGYFMGGGTGTGTCDHLVRLNSDGSMDGSFLGGCNLGIYIWTSIIQNDGKVFIGGDFYGNKMVRFNTNGSLDQTFHSGFLQNNNLSGVFGSALQSDGKIIITGAFNNYDSTSVNNIMRLNNDGSMDTTFTIGAGPDNSIWSIALQSDNKIIIGGPFTTFNNLNRNRITRLTNIIEAVGLQENKLTGDFNLIFPNPNNGVFVIKTKIKGQGIITNLFGQTILEVNLKPGEQRVNIQNHPSGIYFVKIISDKEQQTFKLIKE